MELDTRMEFGRIEETGNLAELLSEKDREAVGSWVVAGYEEDRVSRTEWEEAMEKASKLAIQFKEMKTFPWPGASSVKFPLVTIACLQFHSRAYPALVDLPDLVKCRVAGAAEEYARKGGAPQQVVPGQSLQPAAETPEQRLNDQASRISEHMNWQLSEEDEEWEEGADRTLLVQPLMGVAFKKSYFSGSQKINKSELILPQDLVLNYWAKSVEDAPRVTHVQTWWRNDFVERERRGEILETDVAPARAEMVPFGLLNNLKDKSQGLTQPATNDTHSPFTVLEQLCQIDLDGDGYEEPYVALVRYDTKELLSLQKRFFPSKVEFVERGGKKEVVRIEPERFYTSYYFIPAFDGGIYGLGFGRLLGPLNESIDTALNQMFDAATLANAGGGFIGRGAKMRGGEIQLRPGKWVRTDTMGDDLRKSIVSAPTPQPSPVLFQLVGFLVDYGQRVAGAPDVMQGANPGQNTPAETSRSMLENGMKVFNGIYKRTYRAFKGEFRKLYRLNQLFLPESSLFVSPSSQKTVRIRKNDYLLPFSALYPTADPNYMSESQRMAQAQALAGAATTFPGANLFEVVTFVLKAWKIPCPERFFPDPKGPNAIPAAPDPKLQLEQLKQQPKQAELQLKQAELQMKMQQEMVRLQDEHALNGAKIVQLEAQAAQLLSEAAGKERGHQIAEMETMIGMVKLQQESKLGTMKLLTEVMKMDMEAKTGEDR